MKALELRGESDLLAHFAHIRIAPMLADPHVVIAACPGGVSVRVELPVFERHDGARWTIGTERFVPAWELDVIGRTAADLVVREELQRALCHEVDECLRGEGGAVLREAHSVAVVAAGQ